MSSTGLTDVEEGCTRYISCMKGRIEHNLDNRLNNSIFLRQQTRGEIYQYLLSATIDSVHVSINRYYWRHDIWKLGGNTLLVMAIPTRGTVSL